MKITPGKRTGGPAPFVPVAIFGGRGGGAQSAFTISRLEALGQMKCVGFLNDIEPVGTRISGYPVLGSFASWRELPRDTHFVAPLHKAKQMAGRAEIIRGLGVPRDRWATVIDAHAILAPDVTYGIGIWASAGCSIMCGAQLGDHVAVRAGSYIGHDTHIGDFVMVGVNAVVCGYATVLEGAHVAPGAVVREGATIGRYSVVGLGAVVIEDVPDGAIVAGNPARVIASAAAAQRS